MKNVWVLVADEAIARILEQPQEGGDLVSVEELTDPDAHAASDSERHQQAQLFAARIADRLAERRSQKRYDLLHIVAAPRLLGCLRKSLPPAVADVVASTLDKDLVQQSHAELSRRLADELREGMALEARH